MKISEQTIFIEEEGEVLQGKRAASAFAKSYAKESNTTIPKEREREVRKEASRPCQLFLFVVAAAVAVVAVTNRQTKSAKS